MAITILILAEGQLAGATGDLYTVPANTTAIIKNITLVNTTGGALTCNLYIKKSGSSDRRISQVSLAMAAGEKAVTEANEVYTLAAGDKIRGDASAATSIDYIISGVEKS